MREMMRMIVVLSLICGASGPALASVFGPTDNDPIADRTEVRLDDGTELLVFPARKDGKLEAVAFETFAAGFGGDIGVMVGFDTGGQRIEGIGITTMKETPGVGSRTALPAFTDQFRNHPFGPVKLKSGGGDIDAVSGATISSTAVSAAVDKAVQLFAANRETILKGLESGGKETGKP